MTFAFNFTVNDLSDLQAALWENEWPPWQWTPMAPEERPSLFTISYHDDQSGVESTAGFFLPNLSIWLTLLLFSFLMEICSIPTAILIYYFIVQPQQPSPGRGGRRIGTTITGYYLGWSFLVPAWLLLPGEAVDEFTRVDHLVVRFALLVLIPTMSLFRVLEAMYGFAPDYAVRDLGSYVDYFHNTIVKVRDEKGEPISARARTYLSGFLFRLALTGAYQSLFLLLKSFPTYGSGADSIPDHFFHYESLLDLRLWKDSLLQAMLLQLYLAMFGYFMMIFHTLGSGHASAPVFDNPLMFAQSVSEFWGKRWNLMIHSVLKGGVYKPVRGLGGSPLLALVATFVASGMFHEWLLPNVFDQYPNTHGATLAFFLWQAVLIILEATCLGQMTRNWPRPLKTVIVVLSGVPSAHWFIDSYWRSDLFVHAQTMLPMLLPLSTSSQ